MSVVAVPLGLAVGIAPLIACWGAIVPLTFTSPVMSIRVSCVVCWLHSAVEQPPCHHQRERGQEPGLDHAQLSQRGW